jgi:hypothetical protein
MRPLRTSVCAIALALAASLPAAATSSCTPAQEAEFAKVEQVILEQLAHGAALEVIEDAIRVLVPQGADLDTIINNAIAYLESIGALPDSSKAAATAVTMRIGAKRAATGVQ